jgi:hypothetical protein
MTNHRSRLHAPAPAPRKPVCRHGQTICPQCIEISDAAKRMSEIINLLIASNNPFDLRNTWLAIKLADGDFDGNLYATREEAISHQIDERFCAYICMGTVMNGSKPLDAAIFLEFHRQAYDEGMRLHEPEAPQLIMPTAGYDRLTGRVRH